MTKAELLKAIEHFPEETYVVLKDATGRLVAPLVGSDIVDERHLKYAFPFYTPTELKEKMKGEIIIVIG